MQKHRLKQGEKGEFDVVHNRMKKYESPDQCCRCMAPDAERGCARAKDTCSQRVKLALLIPCALLIRSL
jgi:hypothetical protein